MLSQSEKSALEVLWMISHASRRARPGGPGRRGARRGLEVGLLAALEATGRTDPRAAREFLPAGAQRVLAPGGLGEGLALAGLGILDADHVLRRRPPLVQRGAVVDPDIIIPAAFQDRTLVHAQAAGPFERSVHFGHREVGPNAADVARQRGACRSLPFGGFPLRARRLSRRRPLPLVVLAHARGLCDAFSAAADFAA